MSICVLWVLADNIGEISNGLLVLLDHLVCLGSLVDESQIVWHLLNALCVGEDRLLELFKPAVCEAQMVEDVGFVGDKRIVSQRLLHGCDALLVLLVCELGKSELVEHSRVAAVDL